MDKPKVYLAGPDVFLQDAIEVGKRKKRLCKKYGFDGLYPFDNKIPNDNGHMRRDTLIYHANAAMIREADCGIFNLTPFRGPSADVGTVFELGMLIGLEKPAFGYTNSTEDLLHKTIKFYGARLDPQSGVWRDASGMLIEDFSNADNLMIEIALAEQGYPIIRHQTAIDKQFHDLTAFEKCLRVAAVALGLVSRSATIVGD